MSASVRVASSVSDGSSSLEIRDSQPPSTFFKSVALLLALGGTIFDECRHATITKESGRAIAINALKEVARALR